MNNLNELIDKSDQLIANRSGGKDKGTEHPSLSGVCIGVYCKPRPLVGAFLNSIGLSSILLTLSMLFMCRIKNSVVSFYKQRLSNRPDSLKPLGRSKRQAFLAAQ
jgi:hypothetical protein